LPRLFTKFATKSYKGTGLGLYNSKNIVEAHDGKLYAVNNPDDKGATFSITLPSFNKEQKQEWIRRLHRGRLDYHCRLTPWHQIRSEL